jgi:hypothetical protein
LRARCRDACPAGPSRVLEPLRNYCYTNAVYLNLRRCASFVDVSVESVPRLAAVASPEPRSTGRPSSGWVDPSCGLHRRRWVRRPEPWLRYRIPAIGFDDLSQTQDILRGRPGWNRARGAQDVPASGPCDLDPLPSRRGHELRSSLEQLRDRIEVALDERPAARLGPSCREVDRAEWRRIEGVNAVNSGRHHQIEAIANRTASVDVHRNLVHALDPSYQCAFIRQRELLVVSTREERSAHER